MKHIKSTTGSKITFALNGEKKIVIDTVIPVEVSEQEYDFLYSRLGNQITPVEIEGVSTPATDVEEPLVPETPEETIPPVAGDGTDVPPEAPEDGATV